MNKPDPKDYPPLSPHDLEWGGIGSKYYEDLAKWEAENRGNENTIHLPIKFSKEVCDFIEANAAYSNEGLPNKWYWFPQYYKKVGEGLFVVTQWKDLPDSLKHIVEQSEPRNQEVEDE